MRFTASLLILLTATLAASAQRLGNPTLTPKQLTAAQNVTLNEGVALHDAKRYAEAIAKYRTILSDCEDCTHAIYELALSLNAKGDKLEAVETAYRGTKYISDELPLFYEMIANHLDDLGKPDDAVTVYRDGLKLLGTDARFRNYRGRLNYNLGLTLYRQKKYSEARHVLKSAVEDSPLYPSPHYLLSVIYSGTRYKIPAMLAAARLVSLEFNTQRSTNSAALFVDSLKPAAKDPKSGNMTINLDFDAPKDEGDFGMFEILLPTITSIGKDADKKKLSKNQVFADAVGSIVAMLEEDKKIGETFVGRNYIPFMSALKRDGHLDTFANLVLFLSDRKNTEAGTWLDSNGDKVRAFFDWAKTFRPGAK